MFDRTAALVLFALSATTSAAWARADPQDETALPLPGARYVRLVEYDGGRLLRLEIAARTFVPKNGSGPEILLAAAVHIAEPSFYRELQDVLDARDIVIFESVKPAGTGDPAYNLGALDDDARIRITVQRLRLIAVFLDGYFDDHGRYPADIAELAKGLPLDRTVLLDIALADGWNTPIELVIASATRRGKFDLVSLGSDGHVGGDGHAADRFFSDQPPITSAELGKEEGIQEALAQAMGLVFQLDEMDHTGPQWFNGDLAMDQIAERLGESQVPGELFGMLSGESMMVKVGSTLLRFIGKTSTGSTAMKLVGIELLGRSDELLDAAAPILGDLLEVLIQDRNEVVLAELRRIVSAERERQRRAPQGDASAVERVGVIYGAAHMRDMEQRLIDELGYVPKSERWIRAVELDLGAIGISLAQVGWIRRSIQAALELQLGN